MQMLQLPKPSFCSQIDLFLAEPSRRQSLGQRTCNDAGCGSPASAPLRLLRFLQPQNTPVYPRLRLQHAELLHDLDVLIAALSVSQPGCDSTDISCVPRLRAEPCRHAR